MLSAYWATSGAPELKLQLSRFWLAAGASSSGSTPANKVIAVVPDPSSVATTITASPFFRSVSLIAGARLNNCCASNPPPPPNPGRGPPPCRPPAGLPARLRDLPGARCASAASCAAKAACGSVQHGREPRRHLLIQPAHLRIRRDVNRDLLLGGKVFDHQRRVGRIDRRDESRNIAETAGYDLLRCYLCPCSILGASRAQLIASVNGVDGRGLCLIEANRRRRVTQQRWSTWWYGW